MLPKNVVSSLQEVNVMENRDEIAQFCTNVRRFRERAGLSQKEFADALDVNPETIRLLEDGSLTDEVDVELLFRMSELLGLELSALFHPLE